jgi:hypothetical protein
MAIAGCAHSVAAQPADPFATRAPGSLEAYKSFGERFRPAPLSDPRSDPGVTPPPRSIPGLQQRDLPKNDARREPYPYSYYNDKSRGDDGCGHLARRAIETKNDNWWARYRACTQSSGN